jgi:hypothetical protein
MKIDKFFNIKYGLTMEKKVFLEVLKTIAKAVLVGVIYGLASRIWKL